MQMGQVEKKVEELHQETTENNEIAAIKVQKEVKKQLDEAMKEYSRISSAVATQRL